MLSLSICALDIRVDAEPAVSASADCLAAITEISFRFMIESPYWLASNPAFAGAANASEASSEAVVKRIILTFKT